MPAENELMLTPSPHTMLLNVYTWVLLITSIHVNIMIKFVSYLIKVCNILILWEKSSL